MDFAMRAWYAPACTVSRANVALILSIHVRPAVRQSAASRYVSCGPGRVQQSRTATQVSLNK